MLDEVLGIQAVAAGSSPRTSPHGVLVPDLVMTFTCAPDERPCVASNRFEMNWNSAMASRPKLGCRFAPPQQLFVTCMPSTLSWTVPSAGGHRHAARIGVVRAGARRQHRQVEEVPPVHRQLRICRESMFPPS